MKDNLSGLTLKPFSATRWESCVDSVKAIRFQMQDIREALLEISDTDNDATICNEAKSLANNEVGDFEFIVAIIIRYEILSVVNLVSKKLQAKDMLLDVAIEQVQGMISFFSKYRETCFANALESAKEIAREMDVEPAFRTKRKITRKRQFMRPLMMHLLLHNLQRLQLESSIFYLLLIKLLLHLQTGSNNTKGMTRFLAFCLEPV